MTFQFSFSGSDIEEPSTSELPTSSTQSLPLSPPQNPTSKTQETGSLSTTLHNTTTTIISNPNSSNPNSDKSNNAFPVKGKTLLSPTHHSLAELIERLPGRVAFRTLFVDLEGGGGGNKGEKIEIKRRELWDVRVQVAFEDLMGDGDGKGNEKGDGKVDGGDRGGKGEIEGLGNEDVKTGVYEGGFKSWECGGDLVGVLGGLERERKKKGRKRGKREVVELGCGTALPSLAVLRRFLMDSSEQREDAGMEVQGRGDEEEGKGKEELHLLLADYNPSVLSLVTLPNLLLNWAFSTSSSSSYITSPLQQQKEDEIWKEEGELSITPSLLQNFTKDLEKKRIKIDFFSGCWGEEFVGLVRGVVDSEDGMEGEKEMKGEGERERELMVLGAETIYSPFALEGFAGVVVGLLLPPHISSSPSPASSREEKTEWKRQKEEEERKAVVAAKKIYFGGGGSLSDFCERVGVLSAGKLGTREVREEVGRVRRGVVKVFVLGGGGGGG